jgi:hypothetical protein
MTPNIVTPLRADVYDNFHFIETDPMVAHFILAASINYQYRWSTLIQPISSTFRGPTLTENTNC